MISCPKPRTLSLESKSTGDCQCCYLGCMDSFRLSTLSPRILAVGFLSANWAIIHVASFSDQTCFLRWDVFGWWGREQATCSRLARGSFSCLSTEPEIASPLHPKAPALLCSGCSPPSALLELKFSERVADAFFVKIHSPWQSSRAHGNAYLFDLAFVWLALYLVCFALCRSFSLQIFMFRFLGPRFYLFCWLAS